MWGWLVTGLSHNQREELGLRISEAKRAEIKPPCPIGWASTTGYRKGCRCPECTFATSTARLARKKRAA